MAKRKKQIRRRVSKKGWTRGEIDAIRKGIEEKHGNGPRAQSRINDEIRLITATDLDGRIAWRRAHHRGL